MDNRPWKGYCRCGKRLRLRICGMRDIWTWFSHPDGSAPCIDFSSIPLGTPLTRDVIRRAL